jgi:hypothetical protein
LKLAKLLRLTLVIVTAHTGLNRSAQARFSRNHAY